MTPKKNEEPKNLEEQKTRRRKYEILDELEEWLDQEIKKNRDRKGWFELQLIDSFQTFSAWRKERGKEENIEDENTTRKRVA